ncbi:MAG: hypothetical protein OEW48_09745 [Phycisphaerae bacterium]|nr:hypothetical protein [Phycisphaerae bacterium]
MRNKQIKKLLCVLCLVLPVVLSVAAAAQSETSSVLDRVQKVEDPELGDLIRLAMENRKISGEVSREEAFEIVRKVTQSFAQIKLLDLQIEQIAHKAEATRGPAEMRYELLLAKAELESKRAMELANLRELAGIVPKLPLAEQPLETLNTYISIQMIGERLYVLDCQRPFIDFWAVLRWKLAGFLSEKETLDYLLGKLKDKDSLPIRIVIYYDPETKEAATELRNKIISVAKETNSQMDTEVRPQLITYTGSGNSTFFLRQGKITTFYTHAMQRPDGGPEPLVTGLVNPNDLEQHILWRLTMPKNVPLTFRIEHDQASASLTKQIADMAGAVVKRLGIGELVNVKTVLVEPVAEGAFLGRWRGESRGDVQEIDVRPNGICQVTMGDRFGKDKTPGAIKAGTTVSGRWFLTTNEMVIDIKDMSPHGADYVYRGYLEEDGNLIVDKGIIYPQGTFYVSGEPRQMILKKVE